MLDEHGLLGEELAFPLLDRLLLRGLRGRRLGGHRAASSVGDASGKGRASGPGLEGPIPAPGMVAQLGAAGEALVPRVEHLVELDRGETGLGQAVADLERLPELLPESLELEPAEGELVEMMLGVEGRRALGLLDGEAAV